MMFSTTANVTPAIRKARVACVRSIALGIFAAFMLLGCETSVPVKPSADTLTAWRNHRDELVQVSDWRLTGRIAILTENEAWNATIQWRQRGDRFRIRISAPLGAGTLQLEGRPGRVYLTDEKNRTYTAIDAEDLLFDAVGWRIPLDGLRYWVLGVPEPESTASDIEVDPAGHLKTLRQLGWNVEILRYRGLGGRIVPDKLYMTTEKFNARLVINHWQLSS